MSLREKALDNDEYLGAAESERNFQLAEHTYLSEKALDNDDTPSRGGREIFSWQSTPIFVKRLWTTMNIKPPREGVSSLSKAFSLR